MRRLFLLLAAILFVASIPARAATPITFGAATARALGFGSQSLAWSFNPADASLSSAALTNGNRTYTATTSGPFSAARGFQITTGNVYFEARVTGSGGMVGVANATQSLTGYIGQTTNSMGYANNGVLNYNAGNIATYSTYTTGDVIGVAVSIANGKVWWAKNNVWQGSSNPATNTGGVPLSNIGGTGSVFPAASVTGAGVAWTIPTPPIYQPPAGFIYMTP